MELHLCYFTPLIPGEDPEGGYFVNSSDLSA